MVLHSRRCRVAFPVAGAFAAGAANVVRSPPARQSTALMITAGSCGPLCLKSSRNNTATSLEGDSEVTATARASP